jgi:hypothetical protein
MNSWRFANRIFLKPAEAVAIVSPHNMTALSLEPGTAASRAGVP